MSNNENLCIKVDENVCKNAKMILEQLGIPISIAVNIFLRQVVLNGGFPFNIDVAEIHPIDICMITNEEIIHE